MWGLLWCCTLSSCAEHEWSFTDVSCFCCVWDCTRQTCWFRTHGPWRPSLSPSSLNTTLPSLPCVPWGSSWPFWARFASVTLSNRKMAILLGMALGSLLREAVYTPSLTAESRYIHQQGCQVAQKPCSSRLRVSSMQNFIAWICVCVLSATHHIALVSGRPLRSFTCDKARNSPFYL